jgi:cell division transport system permease protein
MNLLSILSRVKRGIRQDLSLHLITIGGLVIAFVCLAVALLLVTNLDHVAGVWKQSRRVTVYLREDAKAEQLATLHFALKALPEVAALEQVTPEQARAKFSEPTALGKEALSLPADFFPASFELSIHRGVAEDRLERVAATIGNLAGVQEVEVYRDWFRHLTALLNAGRWAAGLLALLVSMCVLAVISHSERLAVSERREQIEVLKLCGATDRFVSAPFIAEGAAQGLIAAFLAVLLVFLACAIWRPTLAPWIGMITGVPPMFLDPLTALAVIGGGGVVGGLSGMISLRRYLSV